MFKLVKAVEYLTLFLITFGHTEIFAKSLIQSDSVPILANAKNCNKSKAKPPGGYSSVDTINVLYLESWRNNRTGFNNNDTRNAQASRDCGEGASAKVPNLNGKSRNEITQILTKYGFKSNNKPSPAGWETFKHDDKSKIDINWGDGRIIRTEKPFYGPDRRIINKGQRIDRDGYKIPRNIDHKYHSKESVDLGD